MVEPAQRFPLRVQELADGAVVDLAGADRHRMRALGDRPAELGAPPPAPLLVYPERQIPSC